MDLTSILSRIATDHGLLGAVSVILSVALFFCLKLYLKCYDERIADLKANHEMIGSFTQMMQQRQASFEQLVSQIANMSRVLELAAQANTATVAKIDRLGELANAAKASNEQMREAVAAIRGK